MSALNGIYFLDGRLIDPVDLQKMTARLSHRGPDGMGIWNKGSVGFGHHMLRTTPESFRDRLPMVDEKLSLVLTADARIDNREDLIASLDLRGRPLPEISDGELILRSYEQWGQRCPEKLLGDFAFAIWDGQRKELFCARDHFGVKPFYYYHRHGHSFLFASEIKALFSLSEIPRRLNETRVADYLVSNFEDKSITFYQEIYRLPPAHMLTVSSQGIQLRSYWALDPTREVRLGSDEDYADAFRQLFTQAVRCRLRSAFRVGTTLSGGLDSSSIACVARQLLSQEGRTSLPTFSAIFDDVPQSDERRFINIVLAQGGFDPHYVHGDKLSPLGDSARMLDHQDEPFYAPNLFLHLGLYHAAQHSGVRVLLDGFDGDTTVSHGFWYLLEHATGGRWIRLASEISYLARHFERSPWQILLHILIKPLLPDYVRRVWRAACTQSTAGLRVNRMINPNFARRIGIERRLRMLRQSAYPSLPASTNEHYRRMTKGLLSFTLEVADKASASTSIEARYPFFDKRLVEFCLGLPGEQKLSKGWSRMVLRRAMANILPSEIQWRGGKSSLAHNFRHCFLGADAPLIEEFLKRDSAILDQYVDTAGLHHAFQRCTVGGRSDEAFTIWPPVSLGLWLRHAQLTF